MFCFEILSKPMYSGEGFNSIILKYSEVKTCCVLVTTVYILPPIIIKILIILLFRISTEWVLELEIKYIFSTNLIILQSHASNWTSVHLTSTHHKCKHFFISREHKYIFTEI